MNETTSLRTTIEVIEQQCAADVGEFILIVCERSTPQSVAVCRSYHEGNPARFHLHNQNLPFIGGAMREGFELARGSHVVMMASDLETDPATVRELIACAKRRPDAIITSSRWLKGGGFIGYNRLKLVSNYIFQKLFSLLYGVNLTDMTYAFRIFPTALVQSIRWEELKHPFFFETLIKPLRLGIAVEEIPTSWKARVEGESQNTFLRNFSYFGIGWRTRFSRREAIVR